MENTYKLTEEGKLEYEVELKNLKEVERPENVISIQEARAQGDLSENADYDAARDEQARIENRISEIEKILKHVEIIVDDHTDIVNMGKRVGLEFNDKTFNGEYRIVGSLEADPLNHRISNESPIGRALIGCKIGDKIPIKSQTDNEVLVKIVYVK